MYTLVNRALIAFYLSDIGTYLCLVNQRGVRQAEKSSMFDQSRKKLGCSRKDK